MSQAALPQRKWWALATLTIAALLLLGIMAMPAGSRYRKPIDVAILEAIHDEAWKETLFQYLGEKK